MSIGSALALATERLVAPVEQMHGVIAGRWFRSIGPAGAPVRWVHDSVARVVYGSIRLGAKLAGIGVDASRASSAPGTAVARGIATGLWGDSLGRDQAALETPMGIAALGPGPPTGRPVVLVHGLFQTEQCWGTPDGEPSLRRSLDQHPDVTAVAIRYNTGRPVEENGEELAALLESALAAWPQPVRSMAMVGHSVGGLVIRSALEAGRRAGHRWVDAVADVVTIGTPHFGAPLEKLVAAIAWSLDRTATTRPLADFLDARSQGIKDLRHGLPGPLHPRVPHHFVAGVVTTDPAHGFAAVVGDLMVRPVSGTAADLEPADLAVVGGVNHFDLLDDPAVIERVLAWLGCDARPEGD